MKFKFFGISLVLLVLFLAGCINPEGSPKCGNTYCEFGESIESCYADCTSTIPDNNEPIVEPVQNFCETKTDCVPNKTCHPDKAINKAFLEDGPFEFACSERCEGPLDCGIGRIDCIENHCAIIPTIELEQVPELVKQKFEEIKPLYENIQGAELLACFKDNKIVYLVKGNAGDNGQNNYFDTNGNFIGKYNWGDVIDPRDPGPPVSLEMDECQIVAKTE
ncbi:MAG: hypothetical protein Q7S92_07145 [Candidatus Diapherotrites archaeon]|nr:hypothetical protein [Candidatus Diapherotrites archaeon]